MEYRRFFLEGNSVVHKQDLVTQNLWHLKLHFLLWASFVGIKISFVWCVNYLAFDLDLYEVTPMYMLQ